ncbi:MAG: DUF2096 family protein [Candidatus Bathyarchaeia archaeon]
MLERPASLPKELFPIPEKYIQHAWLLLADMVVDLRRRYVKVDSDIISTLRGCKILIKRLKFCGLHSTLRDESLAQLQRNLNDVLDRLINLAAREVGWKYATDWKVKIEQIANYRDFLYYYGHPDYCDLM